LTGTTSSGGRDQQQRWSQLSFAPELTCPDRAPYDMLLPRHV